MLQMILEQISPYIWSALGTIIVAVGSYLGLRFKTLYEKKVNTDTKKQIVADVVRMVEQIAKAKGWTSADKLEEAKQTIIALINQSGLKITDLELEILIEAACNSFTTSSK